MTARFVEQRTVDPADLDPYPGNPNVGDVDAIRASLRANGQYRAPVARLLPSGRLQVLAGHATRTAATAEAMPLRVDVIEADDATARRIVLADNRTAQLASYDELLLLNLLREADDLTGTGWDDAAYRELLDDPPQTLASGAPAGPPPTLADRFLIPPFDVLNAREGWWQDRKRQWIATGIKSEVGRDGRLTHRGREVADIHYYEKKSAGTYDRDQEAGLLFGSASARDPDFYRKKSVAEEQMGRPLTLEEFEAEHYTPDDVSPSYESGTSIFDPVLCELAYRWFSRPGWEVLDPFAGGSVRGLVAAMLGRNYTGNDLSADQIAANQEQAADFLARGLLGDTSRPVAPAGVVLDPGGVTPVERRGDVWVKRDDLYQLPGGLAGCGGKVRSCLQLVSDAVAAVPGVDRLVTAGSRHSPQVVIVAAVAKHLGLRCTAHVPASKEGSPELAAAVALGADLVEHRPGYNTVIVARARDDADADPAAVHVPFGMETRYAVTETALQARALFQGWPSGARRLIVPVGSGMTLAGILSATDEFGPDILGVQVGADPTERLDEYAPLGWRDRVKLVQSPLEYEQRPSETDLGDLPLDPVYEAKCLPFLEEGDVLWVVGRRPDLAVSRSAARPPRWSVGDSAEWVTTLEPESADLIFTCPPYLWLEKYSDDPADLSNASTDDFEQAYTAIIAGAARALRPDRYAVFVVGDVRDPKSHLVDFRGMTIRAAEGAGLWMQSGAVLVTQVGSLAVRAGRSFTATRVLGRTHQDVLVFVKGSGSAAAQACGDVDVSALDALEPEDQ